MFQPIYREQKKYCIIKAIFAIFFSLPTQHFQIADVEWKVGLEICSTKLQSMQIGVESFFSKIGLILFIRLCVLEDFNPFFFKKKRTRDLNKKRGFKKDSFPMYSRIIPFMPFFSISNLGVKTFLHAYFLCTF